MEFIFWKLISRTGLKRRSRQRLFLFVNTVYYGLIGYLLWVIFGRNIFYNRTEWLFSFVGYTAVFGGFLMGIMFLFKKDQ